MLVINIEDWFALVLFIYKWSKDEDKNFNKK